MATRKVEATICWVLLMAATMLCVLASTGLEQRVANFVVFVVALIKCRTVLLDYAGMRDAPPFWRKTLQLWVAGCVLISFVAAEVGRWWA